ncbi:MAG: hypothetical protein J2P21_02270 [Chloracidobacterium sp.]|nr:hypothetical protein [Chloracidobacterium sp.]
MPNDSRELLWTSDRRPKTFETLLIIDIDYFEVELCVSDDPEDSRGADEESEPSSIHIHPTLCSRCCQPAWLLKSLLIFLINKYYITPAHNHAHIGWDFQTLGQAA